MKRIILPISMLLVLNACGPSEALEAEKNRSASLVEQNITANARLDHYSAYVTRVEHDLREIRDRQESLVEFLELPQEVVSGDPIPSHLEAISEMLEESRFKLSSMREKLRSESKKLSAQKSENKLIAEKAKLKLAEIDSLEHRLTENTIALEIMHLQQGKMAQKLIDSENKRFQAWFAYGSWDELQAQEITQKEGGILGIGGRKTLSSEMNTNYFTAVDLRQVSQIPLLCDKARLLSSHPSGKLPLERERQDRMPLRSSIQRCFGETHAT